MELILWRHAEAEIGDPDESRALTGKGHKQAAKMAEWLEHRLPHRCKILVSPAIRTIQTAEALGRKFTVVEALAPDCAPEGIIEAANWPHGRAPVLVIGHQPTLGQVAALLLTGARQDWTIRKANIWWIAQRAREHGAVDPAVNYLRAVVAPDLLIK